MQVGRERGVGRRRQCLIDEACLRRVQVGREPMAGARRFVATFERSRFEFELPGAATIGDVRSCVAMHFSLTPGFKITGLPSDAQAKVNDPTAAASNDRLDSVAPIGGGRPFSIRIIGTTAAATEKLLQAEARAKESQYSKTLASPTRTHTNVDPDQSRALISVAEFPNAAIADQMDDEVEAAQNECDRRRDEKVHQRVSAMRTARYAHCQSCRSQCIAPSRVLFFLVRRMSAADRYGSHLRFWCADCAIRGDLAEVRECIDTHGTPPSQPSQRLPSRTC